MLKEQLPIYQIQDFNARSERERYIYVSTLASHLQEHLFIREPHKHDFYIILLITQGSGTHTIDFKKYEVNANQVFFMKPGQVHSWELSADADGMVIFFTSEFYNTEFPHRKLYGFPFFNALLNKPILPIPEAETSGLLSLFKAIETEYKGQKSGRNQMLNSYLNILLISLTRLYQTLPDSGEKPGSELVILQQLEHLLEQHFKEHLPVTFYAEKLNLTTKHLNEVCKSAIGKTTTEIMQERLILEAQRLLVHSELTSSEIATKLGFFDTTYFFRFFKKRTNLTPEQFRNSVK